MSKKEEENVVVSEKGHKGLTALFFILFTIVVLGVLSLILIPKLIKDPVKQKDKNTYEINSEVKNKDIVELKKGTELVDPDGVVDTSKLGEKTVDVVYLDGDKKEIITVKINVVDTTKPEITCDSVEIYEGTTIEKDEYKDLCVITDNSNEEMNPEISGDYDINKAGEYKITVKVKDSSGNETVEDITLVVKKIELHNDGYYVYKTPEQWDEFTFKADGKGSYVPWFCPGSGCGGYGEEGTYKIEGNKIILTTTVANGEGETTNINNVYEFKYVNIDEIVWTFKDKDYILKWQKEWDK